MYYLSERNKSKKLSHELSQIIYYPKAKGRIFSTYFRKQTNTLKKNLIATHYILYIFCRK